MSLLRLGWIALAVLMPPRLRCMLSPRARHDEAEIEASARRMVETRARAELLCCIQHEEPVPPPVQATPAQAAKPDTIASALQNGGSTPWSIVVGLTLLTLLPALLLAMTPMVRLLVVFHFLRQALGTQTAPSNQILMGLALMMTWFLMAPVLTQVEATATTPYRQGTITGEVAIERGIEPVKAYMLRYAREKDLAVFAAAGMATRPKTK